ncbi:alpha-N-acetylgalactosaminide alpha-2,6-sialyltransferase 3-like [Ptychodera flava]|uniref:alpha-N-acetylgalactosaminide alpha-2,6-sialyltransferase 3-like n=1 Tax=Ptychodera flava TaxID=63121 RepID=UPI00396A9E6C
MFPAQVVRCVILIALLILVVVHIVVMGRWLHSHQRLLSATRYVNVNFANARNVGLNVDHDVDRGNDGYVKVSQYTEQNATTQNNKSMKVTNAGSRSRNIKANLVKVALTEKKATAGKVPLVDKIAKRLFDGKHNLTDPLGDHPMGYQNVNDNKQLLLNCNQCALISSSGHLLHTNAGKEIDQFQCVFRMNNNPTKKFSKDVGTRTTLRYIAHSSLGRVLKSANTFFTGHSKPKYVVVWGPPAKMRADGSGQTFNAAKRIQKLHKDIGFYVETTDEYVFTSKIFERITGESRVGNWLTTGWRTMMLALNSCDNLMVYGMAKYDHCSHPHVNPVPFHYYATDNKTECSLYERSETHRGPGHRFETEKLIFEYLSHIYNISFRYPNWESEAIFAT